MPQKRQKVWLNMLKYLHTVSSEGVVLYINEEKATPEKIVNAHCLNEDSVYMPDYVLNEAGKLIEIRYNKIETS